MSESELSQRLITALRNHCECEVFKVHGHGFQQPGWPDFYFATYYFNGWIETKGSDTKLRPAQKNCIQRLKKVKVPVYILRFATDRTFVFEDEEGNELGQFGFSTWKECALRFVSVLHKLEEKIECGTRTS